MRLETKEGGVGGSGRLGRGRRVNPVHLARRLAFDFFFFGLFPSSRYDFRYVKRPVSKANWANLGYASGVLRRDLSEYGFTLVSSSFSRFLSIQR